MKKIKEYLGLFISMVLFLGVAYIFLPKVNVDELRFDRSQSSYDDITRVIGHALESENYDHYLIDIHLTQLASCMEGGPRTDWMPFSVLPGATPANSDVCTSGEEWYVPEEYHETSKPNSFNQCYLALETFDKLQKAGMLINGEPAPYDSFGCMRNLKDNKANLKTLR